MKLTVKLIKEIVGDKGKIFNITFVKLNGELRTFNARLGVKYDRVSTSKRNYNAEDKNLLVVYSMNDKGYRTVNLNTLKRLKANGVELIAN
jgi:hypothetical protein